MSLAARRCLVHPTREAAARCPECARFYCRECVTEHDDRIICASCLKKLSMGEARASQSRWQTGASLLQLALGIIAAWFFFFLVGQSLLRIPDSFHEGTLWESLQDSLE